MGITFFFEAIASPFQLPRCTRNSSTWDMRFFGVLPVLSLLLGALASPQVLDSREPPPRRVGARQIGTNLCVPIEITNTIVNFLPFGFAYVIEGGGASGSTLYLSLISWLNVSVFLNDCQGASVSRPFPVGLPSRLFNTLTNLRPSQLTNL